jgi:hypothetical protein
MSGKLDDAFACMKRFDRLDVLLRQIPDRGPPTAGRAAAPARLRRYGRTASMIGPSPAWEPQMQRTGRQDGAAVAR